MIVTAVLVLLVAGALCPLILRDLERAVERRRRRSFTRVRLALDTSRFVMGMKAFSKAAEAAADFDRVARQVREVMRSTGASPADLERWIKEHQR